MDAAQSEGAVGPLDSLLRLLHRLLRRLGQTPRPPLGGLRGFLRVSQRLLGLGKLGVADDNSS